MKITVLAAGSYAPFYQPYISVLGDPDLLPLMSGQLQNFPEFMASIPKERWTYAYAPGKWTVAEVLLHIVDAERVFQYRALRIARGDKTPLPGFDQDSYVLQSGAAKRSRESIMEEYRAVRTSSLQLFESLDSSALQQTGVASNAPISAGALGFIICGHQKHHRNILRERYL